MIHPLFKLVATRPELLANHLVGYTHLVAVQANEAAAQLRIRALLLGGAVLGVALGISLAGCALLFVAALPLDRMPLPWLLLVVPVVPLVVGIGCALSLQRRPQAWSLKALREQLAADAALLQEVGQP